MGAPGQDIFSGDVSCQTHFFRGEGGSEVPFGGILLVGGQICPALNPALSWRRPHNVPCPYDIIILLGGTLFGGGPWECARSAVRPCERQNT